MINRILYILLATISIATATSTCAIAEYPSLKSVEKLEFNMSEDALKAIHPTAKATSKNNYELDPIELNGKKYSVLLHFADGKLVYVSFFTNISEVSFKEAYYTYTIFGTEISKDYGTPIGKSNFGYASTLNDQSFDEEWLNKNDVVRLNFNTWTAKNMIKIEYATDGKTIYNSNSNSKDKKNVKHPESKIKPLFAELPWYTNKEHVRKKLTGIGYVYLEESSKEWVPNLSHITVQKYSGVISGKSADIICLYDDQDMLIRIFIDLDTKSNYLETYYSIQSDLEKKYGKPWDKGERFEYPFKKGDGHLELALKTDKASIYTTWRHNCDSLSLSINRAPNVRLVYESNSFSQYLEFKEKNTQKDL